MSGWHGPYKVVANLPEAAQVKIRVANQEIRAQYPDVRLTLFLETCAFMSNFCDPPQALTEVVLFIGQLQPGAPPLIFGTRICGTLSSDSKRHPRIHLALQYVIRHHFDLADCTLVRMGRSVRRLKPIAGAVTSTLIHWTNDDSPDFKMLATDDVEIADLRKVTGSGASRFLPTNQHTRSSGAAESFPHPSSPPSHTSSQLSAYPSSHSFQQLFSERFVDSDWQGAQSFEAESHSRFGIAK